MAVLWISLVIIVLDQLTKFMVKGAPPALAGVLPFKGMHYGESRPLLDDILRLTYVENPGIAFGINLPGFKVFFAVFSIVASLAILWYLRRNLATLAKWERVALSLILGGAVGNLIDRVFYGVMYGERPLFYGYVVDFLDFGYKQNWWPVFNIADSAVSVGVVLLMLILLRKKDDKVVERGPEVVSFTGAADAETVSFTTSSREPEAGTRN